MLCITDGKDLPNYFKVMLRRLWKCVVINKNFKRTIKEMPHLGLSCSPPVHIHTICTNLCTSDHLATK